MPDSTILCGFGKSAVTVAKYKQWLSTPDQGWSKKPAFIKRRLNERYVAPLMKMKRKDKNGFLIMAICCLLIETLEAFYQGWPTTDKQSGKAFSEFFKNRQRFSQIPGASLAVSFYEDVRCGILHQAETRKGWIIRRSGPMFTRPSTQRGPTLNATKFHRELARQIKDYAKALERGHDAQLRANFDSKMEVILKNCE